MNILGNTLTVTFTSATAAENAKTIIKNCIGKSLADIYDNKPEIPDFSIEQGTILSFKDQCFFCEDLLDAIRDAVIAVAEGMKNECFSFTASGSDTYNAINIEGKYKKGVLKLNSVFYEEFERKVKHKESIRIT